jgi:transcriptional regulator with XRE-family HTH domain
MSFFNSRKLKAGIGKRIKQIRLMEGLSGKNFLKKIGNPVGRIHLFFMEHGVIFNEPCATISFNMMETLNISIDWFYCGEGPVKIGKDKTSFRKEEPGDDAGEMLDFGNDAEAVEKMLDMMIKCPEFKRDMLFFYQKVIAELREPGKISDPGMHPTEDYS